MANCDKELTLMETIEKIENAIKKNKKKKQYVNGLKHALKYVKKINCEKEDEDVNEPNYFNEYDPRTGKETTEWKQ